MVELYNAELKRLEEANSHTWFTAPWLFAEYVISFLAETLNNPTERFQGATCESYGWHAGARHEDILGIASFGHTSLRQRIGGISTPSLSRNFRLSNRVAKQSIVSEMNQVT